MIDEIATVLVMAAIIFGTIVVDRWLERRDEHQSPELRRFHERHDGKGM